MSEIPDVGLRSALEFVARMAWRADASGRPLTDSERISAIKYHPVVKAFAQSYIEDMAGKTDRNA